MESMTEALPFQTQQPIFRKMGGISELSHMDGEECRKYFNSLNKYRTNLSVMEYAVEEVGQKGDRDNNKCQEHGPGGICNQRTDRIACF